MPGLPASPATTTTTMHPKTGLRVFDLAGIQVRLRDGDHGRLLGDGGPPVGDHFSYPRRSASNLG